MNGVNELSTISRSGTLTVSGTASEPSGNAPANYNPGVTSVTVNGQTANLYADGSFAAAGIAISGSGYFPFTAIAQDNIGRTDTNSITVGLGLHPNHSYDLNGNLLGETGGVTNNRSFAYDDENELTSVWVTNDWRQDFVYDGLLRKRVEKDYSWTGSVWQETNEVRFIYDGYLVVQERDGNNLPRVTYTRGNDLSGTSQEAGGIGGLLARTDMSLWVANEPFASAYYFADAQGNVVAMVNTNGAMVAQYQYDPFGNLLVKSGPLADANRYRFSSKEWNESPNLYYYGYRFYDPNLQRWLNRDPIQEVGGINMSEFAANNPIMWFDLYGFCGVLTINSSGTTGLGIHSWISYTPDSTGETTNYGTWGNNPDGLGNGLHENLEQGKSADASRSEHLDDKQEAKLNKIIKDYKNAGDRGWAYGSPCSSFAAKAWNKATGENLSPFWGPISNPTSLTHSIINANGGNPNGTATRGTGGSLGNSSGSTSNSSSSSSANSSVTPSGDSLHASGIIP